jgi:hypothetical protein
MAIETELSYRRQDPVLYRKLQRARARSKSEVKRYEVDKLQITNVSQDKKKKRGASQVRAVNRSTCAEEGMRLEL